MKSGAFQIKRKYALFETQVHFNQNALVFSSKHKDVFLKELKRFDEVFVTF